MQNYDNVTTNEYGIVEYTLNCKLHRLDGPALIYANGNQCWYQNGLCHRDDGPAIISANGDQYWFKNGLCHRDDGPARIYSNGTTEYFIEGEKIIPLIKNEKFISSNKINLNFKIDVDALSEYDINAIVNIVMNNSLVKPFNKVIGIPSGGLLLEKCFKKFESPKENNILIVDDVLTTGNSIHSYISKYNANQAFVVFNRNLNPSPNVISFFNLNSCISYIKE